MVDDHLGPNPVASTFSICVALRPTAAALSRSMTRLTFGLLISRSFETSWISEIERIALLRRAAWGYSSSVFALWTVTLYELLLTRAPICSDEGRFTNTL